MRTFSPIVPGLAGLTCLVFSLPVASGEEDTLSFRRDVRPILSDKCFACHGPDANTRDADLRLDTREGLFAQLVAGDPSKSELFERISSDDPDHQMPPPDSGVESMDEMLALKFALTFGVNGRDRPKV